MLGKNEKITYKDFFFKQDLILFLLLNYNIIKKLIIEILLYRKK